MKIKHLFGLAVIAAMSASCSSNEDLGTAGPGTGTNEAGVGYATFTINLPSTSGSTSGARGTRAAGDLEFNAGDAKEYNVNDVTLLIFQKEAGATSEDDYKFVEQADLGTMAPWIKDGNHGVTTAATITATLSSIDLTSDYYALAILNNKDADGKNKVTLPTTGDTYGTWNVAGKAAGKFADTSNGFYMANAPVFSTGEPTSLVKVEGVYTTKQKAESNKATSIHVERGLAKVSIASNAFPSTALKPTGTKYNEDEVKITAWNLDVTNKSTFPIHKTAGLKNTNFTTIWSNTATTGASVTRFVDGSNPVFKRVYWGVDPNYSDDLKTVDACKDAFNILDANATIDGAADKPQYCLENTFDIKHMKQGQTTRVVFKATYKPKGFAAGETFYKIGNSTDLWNKADLEAQIKAKAQEVLSETDADKVTVKLDATENDIAGTAGTKILKEANVQHNGANVEPEEIKAINEKLGLKDKTATDPIVGIATYKSGESYYIARIKHFGVLTPWNEGDATYGDDNNDNNTKYLGRYGVLRNNWYELTIGSVSGPGTPDVPTIKPEVPDDENYRYISVSVKILDWAKRSDTVDL